MSFKCLAPPSLFLPRSRLPTIAHSDPSAGCTLHASTKMTCGMCLRQEAVGWVLVPPPWVAFCLPWCVRFWNWELFFECSHFIATGHPHLWPICPHLH